MRVTAIALLLLDAIVSILFVLHLVSGERGCPVCVNLTAYELWVIGSLGIWLYSITAIALEMLDVIPDTNLNLYILDTMLEYGNGKIFVRSFGAVVILGFALFILTQLWQLITP